MRASSCRRKWCGFRRPGPTRPSISASPERMVRLQSAWRATGARSGRDLDAGARRPLVKSGRTREQDQNRGRIMIKRLLLGHRARRALCRQRAADTTLKLTEVITSPERTETLKGIVEEFEDANPGVKVEITSLPWGQAFEKFATMVSAGDTPDVVEMPDRWQALYANNGMLESLEPYLEEVGAHRRAQRPGAGDGALCQQHRLYAALRLLSARDVLQQEALRGGGHRRRRRRRWTSSRGRREDLGHSRQVRLLPARRAGRPQRLGDVRRHHGRRQRLLQARTAPRPSPSRGWVKGIAFLVDLYKNGYAPKDSVNWGFNEIVAGLLFRHLRHARPGSGRADRHRRAHEAGGLRRRADARRGPTARPSRPSAMPAGRCSPTARTRSWPGS